MENSENDDYPNGEEGLRSQRRAYIRQSDFFNAWVKPPVIIACAGLFYAFFHNYTADIAKNIEGFQARMAEAFKDHETRIRHLEQRRR